MPKAETDHPKKVLRQLKKVRDDGRVNMLDTGGVQHAAYDMGLWRLVEFIEHADMEEYTSALDAMGQHADDL